MGVVNAALQWLGVVPALAALTMVAAGLAAAVAAGPLTVASRRIEERTGQIVLSTNPLTRRLGLEAARPSDALGSRRRDARPFGSRR